MLRPRIGFFVKDNRGQLKSCLDSCGASPAEAHYGLGPLSAHDRFDVVPWFIGRPRAGRVTAGIGRLRNWLSPGPAVFWSRFSAELAEIILASQDGWRAVVSADNVATATLLILKERGLLRCALACLLIGVPDWLEQAEHARRDDTLRHLANADCLLVLNHAEADYLRDRGLTRTRVLPFGVDTGFWTSRDESVEDYVGAVGSDPGRDYQILIEASPYPVRILTRLPDTTVPPHRTDITLVRGGGLAEARQFLARARVVVVPLQDHLQPAGQSTALQAMAMGKAIVVTRTRGLWSGQMRDGVNCLFVKPGDRTGMRAAIELAWQRQTTGRIGEQAQATAREHFDSRHLVEAWVRILDRMLEEPAGAVAE